MSLSNNAVIISTESPPSADALLSDTTQLYFIKDISIAGIKRTRRATVLRELPFKTEESYSLNEIVRKFQTAKKQLMNTGMFRNVIVSLKSMQGYDVYVNVEVEERWYLFPMPHVKIIDDSFQEWWTDRKRDLDRINYGFKLTYKNFSGRNDKLNATFVNGYTKQASLRYEGIFLDKEMKWSMGAAIAFGKKKEVTYNTIDNKQLFFKNGDFIHSYFRSFIDVSYRRAIKTKHSFILGYIKEDIADTIYKLNPQFSAINQSIRYPELAYRMSYFDVDFIPYPTKGFAAEVQLSKKGVGGPVNMWHFMARGSGSWHLGEKAFLNLRLLGMVKLPFDQPYIVRQFMGGSDIFMQGYEYYSIDGIAGGYAKATLHQQVINKTIRIPSKKIKRLNNIPFKAYAKVFVNTGYAYCQQPNLNYLNNKMLYSTGFGLDILTFTDFVVKLEWSFNQLGENGLYLHRRNYF